jgi:hypothetical protein
MSADVGRAGMQIAIFLIVTAGALLFVQTPGTASFVITVATFAMGLLFLGLLIVLIRRSGK